MFGITWELTTSFFTEHWFIWAPENDFELLDPSSWGLRLLSSRHLILVLSQWKRTSLHKIFLVVVSYCLQHKQCAFINKEYKNQARFYSVIDKH